MGSGVLVGSRVGSGKLVSGGGKGGEGRNIL